MTKGLSYIHNLSFLNLEAYLNLTSHYCRAATHITKVFSTLKRTTKYQTKLIIKILVCLTLVAPLIASAEENFHSHRLSLIENVLVDHQYHYSVKTLTTTSLFIGASGVLANTGLDQTIQNQWQGNRYKATDEFSSLFKKIGTLKEFNITMPFYVAAIAASQFSDDEKSPIFKMGNWGSRTFRTILLGAPQQALLTSLLGGKRPRHKQANWRMLTGNRSVSGHAFYGAAPFINASHLSDDPFIKFSWLIVSTLPAASRINDNKHYLSQSLLGWGLAYLAASSVNKTHIFNRNSNLIISTVPIKDGGFVGIKLKF